MYNTNNKFIISFVFFCILIGTMHYTAKYQAGFFVKIGSGIGIEEIRNHLINDNRVKLIKSTGNTKLIVLSTECKVQNDCIKRLSDVQNTIQNSFDNYMIDMNHHLTDLNSKLLIKDKFNDKELDGIKKAILLIENIKHIEIKEIHSELNMLSIFNYSEFIVLLLVLTILLLLGFYYYYNKSFLAGLFVLVTFIIYVFPVIIENILDIHHPIFDKYNQQQALIYLLLYLMVFLFSFFFLKTYFNTQSVKLVNISFKPIRKKNLLIFIIAIIILSFSGKLLLEYYGYFSMINSNRTESSTIPLLQLIKAFASYNIASLLIINYLLKQNTNNPTSYYILYFSLILVTLYLALISGSRSSVIVLFVVLFYMHKGLFKNKLITTMSLIFIFSIFKISTIYRSAKALNNEYNYINAIVDYLTNISSNVSLFIYDISDILVTRLNYIDILSRVVTLGYNKLEYTFSYYFNIIGSVPRIFWSEKPIIGSDWHEIGQQLLILGTYDDVTTVGLGIIGESFYELKMFGLFVAIFHAILLFIIDFKLKSDNIIGYVIYPLLSIYVLSRDGFTAVIPGFIYVLFPLLFLLWYTNSFKNKGL